LAAARLVCVRLQGGGAGQAYVFLFFLSLYVLTLKGVSTADDILHYDLVQNAIATGRGYLPPGKYDPEIRPGMGPFVARGTDGHVYLGLPNGLALASLPLGALGRVADAWLGTGTVIDPLAQPDEDGMRKAMAALRRRPSALLTAAINPLASALTVSLFFALAAQLAGSLRDALQAALLLGLATVVWPYSTNYWTQPIAGLFLFASLYASCRAEGAVGWRRALGGGLFAGAAFLCRFDTLPLSFWLLLYCVLSAPRTAARRWAAGLSFVAGIGCALALQASWNAYRFGNWLQMGTGHQRWRDFQGDIIRVLPLQMASPYRGIFVYSPALLLGVVGLVALLRKAPALAVTIAGLSATALVLCSAFVMWRGDASWGPRFLVPLTPFLLLPAAPQIRRWPAAFWMALITGLAIQLPAVLGVQDLFVLSAYHSPPQRDPWQHFWQSDVVPQWTSVLRGNVELWWLASPARALLALAFGVFGGVAAIKAGRLCWRDAPTRYCTPAVGK
jgi:hypothetical protein